MALTVDDINEPKTTLRWYLQRVRDSVVWKLDGLSEYDIRRPMTPTATNLLGLVKHLANVEFGYFGETFDRPSGRLQWLRDDEDDPNFDLWATADESRESIIEFYRDSWRHADETIEVLDLEAMGSVPWWPEARRATTLHRVLVHVISETERHAGHADIIRELIDGTAGMTPVNANLPEGDAAWWAAHYANVAAAAEAFR